MASNAATHSLGEYSIILDEKLKRMIIIYQFTRKPIHISLRCTHDHSIVKKLRPNREFLKISISKSSYPSISHALRTYFLGLHIIAANQDRIDQLFLRLSSKYRHSYHKQSCSDNRPFLFPSLASAHHWSFLHRTHCYFLSRLLHVHWFCPPYFLLPSLQLFFVLLH